MYKAADYLATSLVSYPDHELEFNTNLFYRESYQQYLSISQQLHRLSLQKLKNFANPAENHNEAQMGTTKPPDYSKTQLNSGEVCLLLC